MAYVSAVVLEELPERIEGFAALRELITSKLFGLNSIVKEFIIL